MKKIWKKILTAGLVCIVPTLYFFMHRASFQVARLLQDNTVLQRGEVVPVWGWGKSGEKVQGTLKKTAGNPEYYSTTIFENGTWELKMNPHKAGGPYTLTIEAQWKKIIIKNVYFGDVWLCSGQSNISMKVMEADNASNALTGPKNPLIMYFNMPRKGKPHLMKDFEKGRWEPCTPETVGEFSAVGYYFAKALQEDMDVPIGLMNASVGSSKIEAWMPASCFDYGSPTETEKAISAKLESDKIEHTRITPTCLYNNMIYPAHQFPIKGILWWQGESNAEKGEAFNYRNLFPCLISSWREAWGDSLLPFIYVQLANVASPQPGQDDHLDWPMLRESQSVVAQQFSQVAQVVSFDISDSINIHPGNKEGIGKRLALAAKKLAYGEKAEYSGPIYESMESTGQMLKLKFNIHGNELVTGEFRGSLNGFTIAGADHIFHPADGMIVENKVIVWSEKVPQPVAARYAWERSPVKANLYNEKGLPASPFRTDDW